MTAGQSTSGIPPLRPDDPREVAGYQLLRRIGEGGMGAVYLSRTRGGQPVALKVIRAEFAQDEDFRRRFQQEVQSARLVQGYHVVPVVDHDTTGTMPWLACRYVPGLALDEALTRFGQLSPTAVLQLLGCVAEALRAVHAAGVIHRDLKPSNILLGTDGPWVIDFGIARATDATQLTVSGGLIGTPQYMSPEHALGETLTPATDVFALGLITAVAATGRHPYGDSGAITLATRIANTESRPPDLSGYPAELRPVLERCLAADPASRATPAELAELCEGAAGRSLRDFDDWLPTALAAEIAQREAAVQQALATGPTPTPEYTPTVNAARPGYTPTVNASLPSHAPTATANHPGYAPMPLTAPGGWVPPGNVQPANRRRLPLLIGAAVALAVVCGLVYASTDHGQTPNTSAGQHPSTGQTPASGSSASAGSGGAGQAGPSPSTSSVVAKIRSGPADFTVEANGYMDLDASTPIATAQQGDITVMDTTGAPNLFVSDSRLAIAKLPASGPDPTPDQCADLINRDGSYNTDPLSSGDRFCYKTREGRMAYLVIKSVPAGLGPLRLTITVWELPS
ncbi:serine/threonine-protein kinase [Kitasatospora sp. NPDC052896]|uniref:serine/threonine-protein kinase n=1 Tax=Kitasatospora sp. NPDC052896 TaxID=3364061 RepID=UPI0037C6C43B